MPAATSQTTFWARTKTGGKAGFDKLYGWVDKLGAPVNRLSNKLGSEAFWPTTLDKESDKAARILRSFCKDGFYQEEAKQTPDGPKGKQKVLKKIPAEVIQNAKGLAIFTTMRTGLWVSGAGGSGIVVARLADGSWSPPSGIMLHTAGVGFLAGVDIYDCVVVINTQAALDAFSKIRCTLGGEISAVAGPVGMGGVVDTEVHKRQAPVFTYLKSRGLYAGVQFDGTIIIERVDENERFYGQRLPVKDILSGKVRHPPYELKSLMETIKAAQGDTVDDSALPSEPAPGDFEIYDSKDPKNAHFGVPDPTDDDPFGVLALEQAGLEIREAGTKQRPDSSQFEFNPSPNSPVWSTFSNRRSMDNRSVSGISRRSSWRTSTLSVEQQRRPSSAMVEMGTQTDDLPPPPSPRKSPTTASSHPMEDIPENHSTDDITKIKATPPTLPPRKSVEKATTPRASLDDAHERHEEPESNESSALDVLADGEEEPVVHEVVTHAATATRPQAPVAQVISRARLVEVPKRGPPPSLPPRNPIRNRGKPLIIGADDSSSGSTHRRQTSAGSSPGSTGSRRDSASSMESVELNSALTHRFSKARLSADIDKDVEAPKGEEQQASPKESHEQVMPGAF